MAETKFLNSTGTQAIINKIKSDYAKKATTLEGYGIEDAYTKTATDEKISAAVKSVYKPAGSVAFADLPTLAAGVLGNVYNVTDAFNTTADFVEGAGKSYGAGTNVVVVNTSSDPESPVYKFDAQGGGLVDLTGYQTKTLETAITIDEVEATTVEGALGTLNTKKLDASDLVAITETELEAMWAD